MPGRGKPLYYLESDLTRILAGFCVILIHVSDRFLLSPLLSDGFSWWILDIVNILGKIAVPFFIMLSGFLLLSPKKQTLSKDFYTRRMYRIAIPFIFWVSLYFWWMAFWGQYTITPLFIIQSLLSVSLLHLYFIPLIAQLYVITPLLWKRFLPLSIKQQMAVTLGFLMLGTGLFGIGVRFPFLSPEHNVVAILTIFIPYIGYYLAGSLLRRLKFSRIQIFISCLLVIGSFFLSVLLRGKTVNSPAVSSLSPLIMVMSIGLFVILQKVFSLFHPQFSITKIVRYISATIFGIFLVHIIVIDILGLLPVFSPYHIHSPILFFVFLDIFLGFFISFGVVALIKKIPYFRAVVG